MNEREVKAEVWLPLTQGKVTVIDFDDFEKVRGMKWHANKGNRDTWYACKWQVGSNNRTLLQLHRFLMDAPADLEVDHRDGDGLNNRRRDNLRLATHAQNQHNREKNNNSVSHHKGVTWHKGVQKWQAQIQVSGTTVYLGCHTNEEDAAHAYDAAAHKFFGDYARLNFPGERL